MEKFYSSSLLNFLALFGWINLTVETLGLLFALIGHPEGFLNYNIAAHNFLRHTPTVFLVYLGIVLFVFWCQRFRPLDYDAFSFPYEKIRNHTLFHVFFYGGLVLMLVPMIVLITLSSG